MKHWPKKPLGDLTSIITKGTTPKTLGRQYSAGGVPFLRAENLQGGQVVVDGDTLRIDAETHSLLARSFIHQNDVLLSIAGTIGRAAIVSDDSPVMNCNQAVAIIRLNAGQVLPAFLLLWLKTFDAQSQMTEAQVTQTISNLSLGQIKKLLLPVPPLAEQKRIVKLLNETDELRNLRAQADRRTDELTPALFHEMFGQRIAGPPIVTSTVGLKAPREWRWAKLTEVARLATGHTPSRRHPEWWGGDIPWISLTDIRELDGKIASVTGECVNEEGIAHSSSVKLPKGTVCFSRTASVGFVTVMGQEMATSQDFVNWVCGPELDPIFLMGALMQAREHLRSLASGSTHKTIYFPTVKQFATIVPPIAVQKEFAARVTEIRTVQAVQSASRTRLDDLFQSMLHRAFNGEL